MYLAKSSPVIAYSVVVANQASVSGGGMLLSGSSAAPSIANCILSHNTGYNLFADSSSGQPVPTLGYTDLYSPGGGANHNLSSLPASNYIVEPSFLAYDAAGMPSDVHLSLRSSLVNAGESGSVDEDGTRAALGIYGGSQGGSWDLDGDLLPDWFWPGTLEDAPVGFSPADYDGDDWNSSIQNPT
jgi:hypothetical protein